MSKRIHFCLDPHSSPEQIEKRRASALTHRIWEKSTGPRTEEGKKASSRNSYKNGKYTKEAMELRRAVSAAKKALRAVKPDPDAQPEPAAQAEV